MFPVIDAIAAALTPRDQEERHKAFGTAWLGLKRSLWSDFRKAVGSIETAEKLPFNIGRILGRQSRQPLLRADNGKSCRRAEKATAIAVPELA